MRIASRGRATLKMPSARFDTPDDAHSRQYLAPSVDGAPLDVLASDMRRSCQPIQVNGIWWLLRPRSTPSGLAMTEPSTENVHPAGGETGGPPAMPRWVKVSLLVVGALLLLFAVLKLTGLAGQHGPGRHVGAAPALPAASVDATSPA